MTTFKLPEPACTVSPYEVNTVYWEAGHVDAGCNSHLYTETQFKQAVKDVLEQAAQVCEALAITDCHDSNITRHECAGEIRKMKDAIE